MGNSVYDEEASTNSKGEKGDVIVESSSAVSSEALAQGNSWAAKTLRLAGKFKIEQRGIERVPETERTDTNGIINVGTMVQPV